MVAWGAIEFWAAAFETAAHKNTASNMNRFISILPGVLRNHIKSVMRANILRYRVTGIFIRIGKRVENRLLIRFEKQARRKLNYSGGLEIDQTAKARKALAQSEQGQILRRWS